METALDRHTFTQTVSVGPETDPNTLAAWFTLGARLAGVPDVGSQPVAAAPIEVQPELEPDPSPPPAATNGATRTRATRVRNTAAQPPSTAQEQPPAPPTPPPASMALPPGVFPAGQVSPQSMTAMPNGAGAPTEMSNGHMNLEAFRDQMRQFHTRSIKLPMRVLSGPAWIDGSAKPIWYTAEGVPEELRGRVCQEIGYLLSVEG